MHVGKNIKNLREHLNMTQQDLAERLRMSRSAISRIENKSSADVKLIHSISKVLNVPIIYLLYGVNDTREEINNSSNLSNVSSIRDLYKNSTEVYRKLSHERKSFSRAIGLEIHREIIESENKTIEKFAKSLKINILSLFNESKAPSPEIFLNFIDSHTSDWIKKNSSKLLG